MRNWPLLIGVALFTLAALHYSSIARATTHGEPTLVGVIAEGGHHFGFALDSSGRFFWRAGGVWTLSPTQCPPGTPVDFNRGSGELDPGRPSFATSVYLVAMANGDIWAFPEDTNQAQPWEFTYIGNPLSNPVPVEAGSWGRLKQVFRMAK